MPKGQCPKIKGAICNVPNGICKAVPRGMDNHDVVQVCINHDSRKK